MYRLMKEGRGAGDRLGDEPCSARRAVDAHRVVEGPLAPHAQVRRRVHVLQVAEGMGAGHHEEGAVVPPRRGVDGVREGRHRAAAPKHEVCAQQQWCCERAMGMRRGCEGAMGTRRG